MLLQYIYRLLSICLFCLFVVSLLLLLDQPDMLIQEGKFEDLLSRFSLLIGAGVGSRVGVWLGSYITSCVSVLISSVSC